MKQHIQWIYFFWYYVGWFATPSLIQSGNAAWSLVFPITAFLGFFFFKVLSPKGVLRLLFYACIGVAWDSLCSSQGLLSFKGQQGLYIPIWMISIWLLFISTVPFFPKKFLNYIQLFAVACAIGGPLSYFSASLYDIIEIQSWATYPFYGIFWALFLPFTIYNFKGFKYEN